MRKVSSLLITVFLFLAAPSEGKEIENLGLECPGWKAEWISAPWNGDETGAPEFSGSFSLKARPKKAIAYFCGLGFGELYIGGKKVGNDVLSPNMSNYNYRPRLEETSDSIDGENFRDYHTLYLSYDVTSLLRKGENQFSVLLGGGFYANPFKLGKMVAFGKRKMILQVELEYADGSVETLVSGKDWKVRRSEIRKDDLFEGEVFEAGNVSEWENVELSEVPDFKFVPQTSPTDKVMEVLSAKTIEKQQDGSYLVDFGDYISGWTALRNINLPKGGKIEVKHLCEDKGNGDYIFVSDGRKADYEPRFTWYAFRKVVVRGWPGELKKSDIEAHAVYSAMATTGKFSCSDPLLNRIERIWWRTATNNFHSCTSSDCPHREKRPYTGDGQASCIATMHTFDSKAFYEKWLRDIRDCQNTESGYIPNVAPWFGGGGGVPWGSAICLITWEHYLHFGDINVLKDNYFAMKEYFRWLSGWEMPDGTIQQNMYRLGDNRGPFYWLNLGEWCPPYNLPGENLIHTWYYWKCAVILSKAASSLGLAEDNIEYSDKAEKISTAFHSKFYDATKKGYYAGSGRKQKSNYGVGGAKGYGDGSNIFALAMGVPEDRLSDVLETVKEEFRLNNGHFNTGIYGTGLLGETLCRYGLDEYVYTAMTKRDFPSFGDWIEQGADTTWEQWNGKNSKNHPMFGGALSWYYRCLAGLNVDENEPGYKHIIIKPRPVSGLKWVEYSTETPYGTVAVKWNSEKDFRLEVKSPKGTHTTVYMPDGQIFNYNDRLHFRKSCRLESDKGGN